MPDDRAVLEQLNVEIGNAEDRGDSVWLDSVLAPQLAFRRANGQIVNPGRSTSRLSLLEAPERLRWSQPLSLEIEPL